jgi:hypothetical protein
LIQTAYEHEGHIIDATNPLCTTIKHVGEDSTIKGISRFKMHPTRGNGKLKT